MAGRPDLITEVLRLSSPQLLYGQQLFRGNNFVGAADKEVHR